MIVCIFITHSKLKKGISHKMKVCLANDSFPPLIDGVIGAVVNYATYINRDYGSAVVATPYYPGAVDDFPFDVVRYKSFNTEKKLGYRTGYPFSGKAMRALTEFSPDIIHSHCPMASTVMCRELRKLTGAPLILTYHTKFDLDIQRLIKHKMFQDIAIEQMVKNLESCDEIWAVNRGAGENLKSLGYKGDYVVMKNGVDFENCPPTELELSLINKELGLPTDGTPVFLFVGRILWYKGIRIILDSLRDLKTLGHDFRMIFVGKGQDEEDIKKCASEHGLAENCIFAGPIYDRAKLKTVYGRADMLFLPSVFDNDPLVVKEAAAAHTGSLLIKDSSSADGVTHMSDGVLIEENSESMTKAMLPFFENPALWKELGEKSSETLYLSWEDSVAKAVKRYEEVLKNCPKSHSTPHPKARYDTVISLVSKLHRRRRCKACKKRKLHAKKNKLK